MAGPRYFSRKAQPNLATKAYLYGPRRTVIKPPRITATYYQVLRIYKTPHTTSKPLPGSPWERKSDHICLYHIILGLARTFCPIIKKNRLFQNAPNTQFRRGCTQNGPQIGPEPALFLCGPRNDANLHDLVRRFSSRKRVKLDTEAGYQAGHSSVSRQLPSSTLKSLKLTFRLLVPSGSVRLAGEVIGTYIEAPMPAAVRTWPCDRP